MTTQLSMFCSGPVNGSVAPMPNRDKRDREQAVDDLIKVSKVEWEAAQDAACLLQEAQAAIVALQNRVRDLKAVNHSQLNRLVTSDLRAVASNNRELRVSEALKEAIKTIDTLRTPRKA